MAARIVRADYDPLRNIAQRFGREADACRRTVQQLERVQHTLESGDWIGQGATQFYNEMNSAVLPSLKRLIIALETAGNTTQQILQIMMQAEQEVAALFKAEGGQGSGAAAGQQPVATGAGDKAGTYIIPPFSFSFDFGAGSGLEQYSYSGLSPEDFPWAESEADILDKKAMAFDTLGVVASGVSLVAGLTPHPVAQAAAKGTSIVDIGLGEVALRATADADVLQGQNGLVVDSNGTVVGLSIGRDTIVSGRNFVLGTAANIISMVTPPGPSTVAGAVGLYISASQLDYDIESNILHSENIDPIVFHGPLDLPAAGQFLYQAVLDDWAGLDLSPGLESVAVAIEAARIKAIGEGIVGVGERMGEFANWLGSWKAP